MFAASVPSSENGSAKIVGISNLLKVKHCRLQESLTRKT